MNENVPVVVFRHKLSTVLLFSAEVTLIIAVELLIACPACSPCAQRASKVRVEFLPTTVYIVEVAGIEFTVTAYWEVVCADASEAKVGRAAKRNKHTKARSKILRFRSIMFSISYLPCSYKTILN